MSDIGIAPSDLPSPGMGDHDVLRLAKIEYRSFKENGGNVTFQEFIQRYEASRPLRMIQMAGGVDAIRYGTWREDRTIGEELRADLEEDHPGLQMLLKKAKQETGSDDAIVQNNWVAEQIGRTMGTVQAPKAAGPEGQALETAPQRTGGTTGGSPEAPAESGEGGE